MAIRTKHDRCLSPGVQLLFGRGRYRHYEESIGMIGLTLTVVALAVSAAATETGYIDGREYVYNYDGSVYIGYPRLKSPESGYAYNVKMRLQPDGDSVLFKAEFAKGLTFNEEVEDVRKKEHTFRSHPALDEYFSRPFRVYWENGIVSHFQVTRDEPSFYVNIKRGIVSLFNLNLGVSKKEGIQNPNSKAHYYKVYEENVVGNCETAYVIEHHPYGHTNNIVLNLTKVPNFHKCNSRPNQAYGVFHGYECGEADHEKSHTLHGNAQYHYGIRGDRFNYVIEKIQLESDIAYTPYPMEGQTVSVISKRKLQLIEEKPVTDPIQMPEDLLDITSMVYEFEYQKDFKDPIDLKEPHYLYHLLQKKIPISDIKKLMGELVDVYNDETYTEKIKDKNLPAKFFELLGYVSTMGYGEIETLYKDCADIPETDATEEQKRYRNLFMDILANLGTNPAFLFGKYLIENKKAEPQESQHLVKQLQFHLKEVSEVLLDKFQELCDNENVKKNPTLHITCVISLSNVVFDHCVAQYHPEGIQEGKNVCPNEAAVKYFNYIAKLYEQTPSEKLKYNYVKAAGNIGVKEILPYLEPYVLGSGSHHKIERENAIWALENVGHTYPEEVQALLVPLLFNRTESYELRLASFELLLQYRPQLYELEGMARALKYDPDDQVRSFVYSTFQSLANSTHICDRQISKDAKHALRILEDVRDELDYEYTYSKQHYFAGYDPKYDIGGSTLFSYYASDNGYIPRNVYLAFEDYIGGKSLQTFGIGIEQYGLEKFFDKILGPEGSLGKKSLFDLFKKRSKRDDSEAKKELKEIKEKLNLPVYDYDNIRGELYMEYMGNHLSSIQFDDKTFEQFFKDGRFTIPNIPEAYKKIPAYYHQRFMVGLDKFYVQPLENGAPLLLDYKQVVYCYHKNKESSLRVEPGFFPEDRGGQFPDHVIAETDGHFAIDKHLVTYMAIDNPFEELLFGAGINRRSTLSLPLKVKLDLAVKEKKLKIQWTPVAPHEIYHFNYEPFTFIDSYGNSESNVDEYKPVHRVHRHEIERHFFHDALGVGFDVRADYENEFNDFGSHVDFFLQKDFREKFYYLYANPNFEPYKFDVQFSHAEKDATKEVEIDFSYHFFGEDWTNPHFPEESFEDFHPKKVDRGPLCTRAVKVNVAARGDKERKIHVVSSWTWDLLRFFHKTNFFYERTPFLPNESQDFKICGSSYVEYPKYDMNKFASMDTLDIDHTVHTDVKVHFGKSCNEDQKLNIKGLISRTDEQNEFERRREEPDTDEHYNEISHYYHECLSEKERGVKFGGGCGRYFDTMATLHKYTFHIKHENLSPGFLNKTYLLDRVLKYMFYTHSDHNEIGVNNPVDEVHLEANFSSKLPVADVRVQKPLSNSNYYNVYLPSYSGFRSNPLYEDIHVLNSLSGSYCSFDRDSVSTFDGFNYTTPPIDCYTVLVKDCSPKEHFTVLVANINYSKGQKVLRVFFGDHLYEVMPEKEGSGILVSIDGKRITLANYEPYLYREGDEFTPVFYITLRDHYYTLHSEKYGIIVEYNGYAIYVQVSPYYRSKLCGLCGNFNGQKYDGSTTSSGCYYEDEKAYAYSYSIPSETCSVPKPNLVCPG